MLFYFLTFFAPSITQAMISCSEELKNPIIWRELVYDTDLLSLVKSRIEKGQNLDEPLNISAIGKFFGETPLLKAALIGDSALKITELLLANGADVNCKDNGGNRPLHIAISNYSVETMKLLVEKGADLTIRYGNFTPLERVCSVRFEILTEHTKKKCLEMADCLLKAGSAASFICLQELLRPITYGFNSENEHELFLSGRKNLLKLLIEHGADILATNKEGKTPMQVAYTGYKEENKKDYEDLSEFAQQEDTRIKRAKLSKLLTDIRSSNEKSFLTTLPSELIEEIANYMHPIRQKNYRESL